MALDLPLFIFSFAANLFLISIWQRRMSSNNNDLESRKLKESKTFHYPAKLHGTKVKEFFLERKSTEKPIALLLCGRKAQLSKYCDRVRKFRQERYFYYLSGVNIPGCAIIHDFLRDEVILFLPDINKEDILWSGMPVSLSEAKKIFDCDKVFFMSSMTSIIKERFDSYSIYTTDTDNISSSYIKDIVNVGDKDLFYALDTARLTKSPYEVKMIERAAKISSACHVAIMKQIPHIRTEVEAQAEFVYHAKRQGTREFAYDIICGSGPNGGILHYIRNNESLKGRASILIDAGVEWQGYASDITRSLPLSGKYTKEHREIYETVLDMQTETTELMKPGASWEHIHLLSHKILIRHLLKLGILKDEFNEEELFDRKVTCAFYPHGLGHLMGLDVHDCGGKPNPNDTNPYFKNLRLRRKLQEGMVVTNEPGCYFNEYLLQSFLYEFPERMETVNMSRVKDYMYIGGVRIEDDFLITEKGCKKLSSVPSNPDEIEKLIDANK